MAKDYKKIAEDTYNPQKNKRVVALQDLLTQNLSAMEASKQGINTNYDNRVNDTNLQNSQMKNNFSNTMLGRGLGRSSVVGSGLAAMDDKNTRILGDINAARTTDLNTVDTNMANLKASTQNQIEQINADTESEINTLIERLKQQDYENELKERQMQLQEQQFQYNKQMQQQELAYKRAALNKSRSSSKSSNSNSGETTVYSMYRYLLDNYSPEEALQELARQKPELTQKPNSPGYLGKTAYNDLVKLIEEYMGGNKYSKGTNYSNTSKNSRKYGGFTPID